MSGPANTPMFEQYRALKAAHPDAILFYRMGDFYETFFQDAQIAARELDLTLTSRNKNDPEPIPMAGVPHHSAAGYIQRLVEAGYRVAIAEQVEDPALVKGLVKREVTRVVTPGVVLDPTALAGHQANWLAAVARGPGGYGLAFLEVTTGDLRATEVGQLPTARAELARFAPREVLLGPGVERADLGEALEGAIESQAPDLSLWGEERARAELEEVVGHRTPRAPAATIAAGVAVSYARQRLGGSLRNVHEVRSYTAAAFMVVDETSRRNLELFKSTADHKRQGSLWAVMDRASTAMGSRRIADWLSFPLLDAAGIRARQGAVGALLEQPTLRAKVRELLGEVADIARIGARIAQRTVNPRELGLLARSLDQVPPLAALLEGELAPYAPADPCADLAGDIARTLVDDPPAAVGEGGLIREGVDGELDRLTRLSLDGVSVIDGLEAEEKAKTGISSLKIRRNRVFGYYIEITTANLHRVPERYLRKQTLSNCERYVTPELKDLEERVLGADARRLELEAELFAALRERIAAQGARLLALADRLATVDALAALAEVAARHRWVRPEVEESRVVDIVGGRHPVVEQAFTDGRFVPNDVRVDPEGERRLLVITGPNMAGKSTVLRMVALIVLLAQIGSYVPAESARIGLCDRIFTRVGAADDLRRGRSTFMVEMAETAAILHHATERSLVVLDEIGRGTSTYDGLAIAWAVAEDLHERIGCRTLFATHYHELCELPDHLSGAVNLQVAVSESGGDVIFLHRLVAGGASRSYGIGCAKLAGLPGPVIERARRLLGRFEHHPRVEGRQLGLFAPPPEAAPPDRLRERVTRLNPDQLSPREALAELYALKDLL